LSGAFGDRQPTGGSSVPRGIFSNAGIEPIDLAAYRALSGELKENDMGGRGQSWCRAGVASSRF
jgi:hypothetical protein